MLRVFITKLVSKWKKSTFGHTVSMAKLPKVEVAQPYVPQRTASVVSSRAGGNMLR